MVWFSKIADLQFYNLKAGAPCYCEQLVYPNDLILQAIISRGGANTLSLAIDGLAASFYVYSPDGLTEYEDASTYFEYYVGVANGSGDTYLNARLKSYSPAMCNYECFLVRLVITNVYGDTLFDKYTERYCIADCCDIARDVTFSQDGVAESEGANLPVVSSPTKPFTNCGKPLIRLITKPDCGDVFSGNYYGEPNALIIGTASFTYTKISSFKGRVVQRPREITREISYNCVLQRSTSARQYLLEGYEYFPAWKMDEIECQLHSNHIYIDDYTNYKEYQFSGGVIFDQPNKCYEIFKLKTFVEDCILRQIFGCPDPCVTNTTYFIIPAAYTGSAPFYGENGLVIAYTYDGEATSPYTPGLLEWFASQDGITSVEDIDITGLDCEADIYGLIAVQGYGYIPSSIFFNYFLPNNKIYAIAQEDITDICGYVANTPCAIPVNNPVIIESMACATPTNDTVIIITIAPTELTINGYFEWVADGANTEGSVIGNQVTMSLKVVNTSIIADAGTEYYIGSNTIGTVSIDGRPTISQLLNADNSAALSGDWVVIIDPTGAIYFSGTINIVDANEAVIDFDNLVYNIT